MMNLIRKDTRENLLQPKMLGLTGTKLILSPNIKSIGLEVEGIFVLGNGLVELRNL